MYRNMMPSSARCTSTMGGRSVALSVNTCAATAKGDATNSHEYAPVSNTVSSSTMLKYSSGVVYFASTRSDTRRTSSSTQPTVDSAKPTTPTTVTASTYQSGCHATLTSSSTDHPSMT